MTHNIFSENTHKRFHGLALLIESDWLAEKSRHSIGADVLADVLFQLERKQERIISLLSNPLAVDYSTLDQVAVLRGEYQALELIASYATEACEAALAQDDVELTAPTKIVVTVVERVAYRVSSSSSQLNRSTSPNWDAERQAQMSELLNYFGRLSYAAR